MSNLSTAPRFAAPATAPSFPEPTYKVPQVADYLGVSNDAVYKLVRERRLRSVRVGRLVRITESALVEFMAGE